MNILSLENVSKNYGIKPLFEDVTLGLEDTDRIGIIGANGSGKTTLLRVIAGLEQPDQGRVTRANGKTLNYLAQNPRLRRRRDRDRNDLLVQLGRNENGPRLRVLVSRSRGARR